uniref:Cobalamin biosynthesis protein CobD n=1 Tax=Odontella aurita TaxID=265563 RepID=A0A7S4MVG6_9STRA|mmetsp:Transcript_35276/g.105375  ORF Transcript_35276/g.105375 Transcript_35276/m.105375 type:complete len:702 (+) Transcript_35276:1886-3991(+)
MSPPAESSVPRVGKETETKLESGTVLRVDDRRAIINLPPTGGGGWTVLSSAVLNGGPRTLPGSGGCAVLNSKCPADYDGVNPEPEGLLRRLASDEGLDPSRTIGLLTAASMKTLRTASRNADGGDVVVDAVVTAGISNSRAAGADADYFLLGDPNDETGDDADGGPQKAPAKDGEKSSDIASSCSGSGSPAPPGTINTVIVTTASLTPGALAEAYAIAVEAKCAACADFGVRCAKDPAVLAQGTGTDSAVLISSDAGRRVRHSGKHTLFAEMAGQAVREATREAILTNIYKMHGSYPRYVLHRWAGGLGRALRGSRPCVPPRPMMPVPWPPPSVIAVGAAAVLLAYAVPGLPRPARTLAAVVAWDRCLGEPPLRIHPVCLVGNWISAALRRAPERIFTNPALGFLCGWIMLLSTVALSLASSWLVLTVADSAAMFVADAVSSQPPPIANTLTIATAFLAWLIEVLLVKSASSLQLLCTLALQMAKYLERRQIPEARSQLSWLCSRDPSSLNSEELACGTLESLAENLSDGFVAPIFWYVACGPLGALGYRVVNTLDSRIGYRGKYEWFGKPSARFDDLLNLVPARMTACLLAAAAVTVPGCDADAGMRTAWTDCSKCESPNAGWPMGAMAGLLGVRLEKKGEYSLGRRRRRRGGVKGDDVPRLPGPGNIRAGHSVAQRAGGAAALLGIALLSAMGIMSSPV